MPTSHSKSGPTPKLPATRSKHPRLPPAVQQLQSSEKRDQRALVILGKLQTELMAWNGAMRHARALPARGNEVVFQTPRIKPVFKRTYRPGMLEEPSMPDAFQRRN